MCPDTHLKQTRQSPDSEAKRSDILINRFFLHFTLTFEAQFILHDLYDVFVAKISFSHVPEAWGFHCET